MSYDNKLTYNLLQAKPHKWWKRDRLYIPLTEDLDIDYPITPEKFTNKNSLSVINNLYILQHSVELINDIIPTKYDYCYAINMEIMEFYTAKTPEDKELEMCDIAIFAALALKSIFNVDLTKIPIRTIDVELDYIYALHPDFRQKLIEFVLLGASSRNIKDKLKYNIRREDHGNPRR